MMVYFPDNEDSDIIQEEIFKELLDHQLRTAIRYIKNSFVEKIGKNRRSLGVKFCTKLRSKMELSGSKENPRFLYLYINRINH